MIVFVVNEWLKQFTNLHIFHMQITMLITLQQLLDLISILQQNSLQRYGHVLRKEDNDWVKKCMEYEVEGARPRGRPKKPWRQIVEKECQAHGL